jgi:uncharacterized protein (UPF0218 family)
MATRYRLTPETRRKLKKPIGTLIRGPANKTMKKLKNLIEKQNPPMVISVGDIVSKNLTKSNMFPMLSIIDNKVMRRQIQPIELTADETIHVKNPPGTITEEAITKIQEALKADHRTRIIVDGEEDLLTLAAALHAPANSLVVYGQPRQGIVVVEVTDQKRTEIIKILEAIEVLEKLNKEEAYQVNTIPEEKPWKRK